MIEGYSTLQLAWTGLVVLFAFVVRGASGFGSGLVAIPLLVFALPIHVAVPMMGLLVFILFLFLTVRDRRDVLWDELMRLLPPTLLGVAAGALLFRNLDSSLLVKLLGLFIVGYALYVFGVHYFGMPQMRCSPAWAYPLGFLSAAFDTLFGGGGGTLIVVYMHLRGVGGVQFRATVAMLWFFEMIARIASYAIAGFYTAETLLLVALMLPLVWAGTRIGERIADSLSQEVFSRLLAALLLASGASLLVK
jgi:uncharacterized membrane protein YfcA